MGNNPEKLAQFTQNLSYFVEMFKASWMNEVSMLFFLISIHLLYRVYMMEWKYNHKRLTIAYFPTSFPLLKSCYFSILSMNWYLFFWGRIHKRSFRLGYFWSILQIIRRIWKNVTPKIISLPSSPHTQKHRHCEEAWIMSAWQWFRWNIYTTLILLAIARMSTKKHVLLSPSLMSTFENPTL